MLKRFALLILFLFIFQPASLAYVSPNVPINHWSYDALDKLSAYGLIDSFLISSKPLSRMEMGRLVAEAKVKAQRSGLKISIETLLASLTREFHYELDAIGNIKEYAEGSFFKPIIDPYFEYIYGSNHFEIENSFGDEFFEHSNFRFGLSSELRLWNHVCFYVHPVLRYQQNYGRDVADSYEDVWVDEVKFIETYFKIDIRNVEIEIGKDSFWWGPGHHGSLILSNNAEPFDMIKISNSNPFLLPWIFRYLGPFKFVTFFTQLERDRTIPKPNLFGLRFNFKPHPIIELGLSRTVMFGGQGRDEDFNFKDYWKIFWAINENRPGKLDNNQLAGVDLILRIPDFDNLLPLARGITFYCEITGEDEAGGLPSRKGHIAGIYIGDLFVTGRTDLRIEHANNHISGYPDYWYNHHIYKDGYTYKDKIIGHYMGTDADDFFIRITHYLTDYLLLGLSYNRLRKGLSSNLKETKNYGELDLTLSVLSDFLLKACYRYEDLTYESDNNGENHIVRFEAIYDF